MGSKLVLLLGLLVGAFLTFICVNENKNALFLKHNQITQNDATLQTIAPVTSVEPTVKQTLDTKEPKPTPPVVTELEEPIFTYDTKKLSAKFASSDKIAALEEFILTYCPADSCTQDLSFDDNTKDASWQKDALKIAAFLKDKNVNNGTISIRDHIFNLEGELQNEQDMNDLNNLLTAFDPKVYKMENITTIAPKIEVPEVKVPPVEQIQNSISQLLKANPIYFKFNSSNITPKGKEVLDKVISLLKNIEDTKLTVEGHTDAEGDDNYNKLLSQKRANSVKNYLLINGKLNNKINAIGYGEEKPISSNPRDKINRRVEIHLKSGE